MTQISGEQLALTILVLLSFFSLRQWHQLQKQSAQHGYFLRYQERPRIQWNVVFIAICGLLTAAQLINRIQADILQTYTEMTVRLVRTDFYIKAGLTCFLLMLLSEFGAVSLKQFGISFENGKHNLLLGLQGFLATVLPVFLVRFATLPLSDGQTEHALLKLLQSDQATETIFWITISAVFLAPLMEELLYRVLLQGYLEQRVSPGFAIPVIAVVFSAVHPFPMSLALLPLALILGYIYHRSHSYLAVVVTHTLFNATNVLLSLLTIHTS